MTNAINSNQLPLIPKTQEDILRHALGLDYSKVSFRNYYVAGEESSSWGDLVALEAAGLMTRRRNSLNERSIEWVFHVTEAGISYIQ